MRQPFNVGIDVTRSELLHTASPLAQTSSSNLFSMNGRQLVYKNHSRGLLLDAETAFMDRFQFPFGNLGRVLWTF